MKCHTGHLFDLAPDGLGFIVDTQDNRIWAFIYPKCGHGIAPDANSFSKLEGEAVRFLVDDGKVAGVELAAEQYLSAHAAGNSQK